MMASRDREPPHGSHESAPTDRDPSVGDPEPPRDDPATIYRDRRDRFHARAEDLSARARTLANARATSVVAAIGLAVWAEESGSVVAIALAAAALVAFGVLVWLHRRTRDDELWHRARAELNAQGLARLARDWEALPVREPTRELNGHAYAGDLDVYGRASVAQLLGPVGAAGAAVLDEWLLARAEPSIVRARQEAVRELAPMLDLRETLAVHGRRAASVRASRVERFLGWTEARPWLGKRPALLWSARLLPPLTIVPGLLDLLGMIGPPLWLLPLAAAVLLTFGSAGARARREFQELNAGDDLLAHYPSLLAVAANADWRAPRLRELQERLRASGRPAHRELGRLARIEHRADLRSSGMLYLPVQLLTLWDFHVLDALDRWRDRCGAAVRDWLDAAGELEALASLAALAHDHPDWAYPEIAQTAAAAEDGIRAARDAPFDRSVLEAKSLGHPLIPDDERVENDVRVGPAGTFLLVTGSNMSGKSTLLRAIGVNGILAQAGAPVCAERMRLPPVEVWTCGRVRDSLARGVSYFMAELERMKSIVDAADRLRSGDDGAKLLFLLDEILHGTNTAERRIAARRIIHHLVGAGAIGAVTTHDLELVEGPELGERAERVHFRETLNREDGRLRMSFDYRLRPGLATSRNALALVEMAGLPEE